MNRVAMAWLCAVCLWLPAATVVATPPILSARNHPYDPDWPTVYTALTSKCRSCHRPNNGLERQDLSSYAAIMNATLDETDPIVVPGDPESSPLWHCVSWNADAQADSELPDEPEMPPEQHEWLTAGQQQALYRWIVRGAHEFRSPHACRMITELDFPSAKICAGCHPSQYDQWSRSMHAYAQHSPVFQAFTLTMAERTSGTIGTFCTRCHTPIGTAMGETGLMTNDCRTRLSMEGVTCVACHRRDTAHYKNNGRMPVLPGRIETACMFGPFQAEDGRGAGGHASIQQPYFKTSQFCGECHDVVTPTGVRNEEAFSEWQRSPAARDGITCQMCHMGPVQGVPVPDCERPLGRAAVVPGMPEDALPLRRLSDHTFAGPDYSLLPDTEFPHKLDWMYETDYRDPRNLTPYQQATLRDLRVRNRKSLEIARQKRFELLSHAARLDVRHPATSNCGSKAKIRVDVQSLVAGHNFPTGFVAERQLWVFIEVRDPQGATVFSSGDLDRNYDLRDDHSHEVLTGHLPVDRQLLSFASQFTALTFKGTERSVVVPVNRHITPINILRPTTIGALSLGRPLTLRIAKGSIAPLTTSGRTYVVQLPKTLGRYQVHVRLRFLHLPPTLLDHVGVPHLKPQLEIVDLDQSCTFIQVVDSR